MGIDGFSHIGLCVSDLTASTRFYEEVLGFRTLYSLDFVEDEVATTMEQSGPFTSRMLVRDDVRIELLWWQDREPDGERTRRPMTRLGFTHLSFRVDRIDDLFDAVTRCGGAVWPETMSVLGDPSGPGEPVRLVYLTDPDGTRIEVMSGTPALGN
jgi:glyoxylase I family protein